MWDTLENMKKRPEIQGADEVVIYQDRDGILVTNERISTAEGEFLLSQIEKIEARASSFLLPEIAHWVGSVLMVAGLVAALLWIFWSRGSLWVPAICIPCGFLLIWIGTESKGYERRLAASGRGFSRTIFRCRRPWGKGWHLGEANEARYWKLKEAIESGLAKRPDA